MTIVRKTICRAVLIPVCVLLPQVGNAADHEIVQRDRTFSKTEITINVGDHVIFKNDDEIAHNVYSISAGLAFDLKRQAPGASSNVAFSKEGTAEVLCSIHPKMKLIVHVVK